MTFAASVLLVVTIAGADSHPAEFWRAIVRQKYEVPAGENAADLADELVDLLGSPDPELRDEIAYSTLTSWIYERKILDSETVRALAARFTQNLTAGIGERGTDTVYRRSFSALMLSVVIARDNAAPFLRKDEIAAALEAALAYLKAEQDIRGYDPAHGWMHSAAHTADLVRFLARSRPIEPADQARILDAIVRKLADAPTVFTHGEDERFARAVLSIVNRADFDREAFRAWTLRSKPAPLNAALPSPAQLAGAQNVKNLFAKLEVVLALAAEPSEAVVSARESVRAVLRGLF